MNVTAGPSLYRRHRPRTFADVVGQEHVVRTLRNAVEQGKVHHAYLFVGSRGTGKTSMAKMLAACMNCEHGPTVEPCGVCESCVAIASATSLDVIEMDAASNNSVDDIRELRESVQFAPVSGRSKVYILDEAHMLSSQAWNAFLKTLEEPPPHTIFVLATTEAQKVLPTVVDRCHRFDFARPTVEQIATVITRVAAAESIEIAPDAVALLARHATGSFRDALGTLEQLVTYTGTDIATDDVLAVLGVADVDLLFEAFDAVASGDARAAWLAAARLADTGRDIAQFLKDLEAHARDLLVVQTLGEVPHELRLTPDRDERLAEQAGRIPGSSLVRLLDLLAEALRTVKDGADARTRLEAALVKAAAPEVDPAARALMARVERLEDALSGAAAPAQPLRAVEPPRPMAPPRAVPDPQPTEAPATPERQRDEPQPAAPAPTAPSPPFAAQAPERSPTEAGGSPPEHAPGEAAGREPEHAPGEAAGRDPEHAPTEAAGSVPKDTPGEAAGRTPEHAPGEAAGTAPDAAPQPTPTATALAEPDLDAVRTLWPAVLDAVRADNGLLAACLAEAHPVEVRGSEVVVAFAEHDTFNRKMADGREHRATVDDALRDLAGSSLRVVFELRELEERSEVKPPSEDELVARFKTEFDAEEIVPDDPQPDEPGGQN
jgi:DNA polymerase-3 subunit gamma/tau